ncbi:MAG: class A beta-lactamase-related serine hydrolase [Thermosediminibacteraceae bacterium]|nr:class A beta-lactamase-related serine hydrolase [Thermosediminibacteraceae bacterium]
MLEERIRVAINGLEGICSVIIHDLKDGEKIFINEEKVYPSASIIKLWILWKLYKEVERGKIDLSQEIILKDEIKAGGFGVLQYLHSGLNPSIKDLATLMIILSDNTATNVLIDILDINAINEEIKQLGMTNTVLQRKMMDLGAKAKELDNFTSAKDTYLILKNIAKGEGISSASRQEILDILLKQQCNNKLPLLMPAGTKFAHKTGDLPSIEHDAGILFVNEREIIVVVMMSNLRDNLKGIKIHNNLGSIIYNYFASK